MTQQEQRTNGAERGAQPDGRGEAAERGVLDGLRVVEFGGFAAGPGVGKHLANYGAEVIRVESRLRLDGFRANYPPFKDNIPGPERAGIFNFYNDGKRSVTLNLKAPRGTELARQLVATADVVVENFTPGTMSRLGLGYERLSEDNPRLVMLSTCNQGQLGPHAQHAGFGTHLTSLSGFTHVLGYPDEAPVLLYGPYIDYIAVGYGAVAVLGALRRRNLTGRGCYIDLSQYESGLQVFAPALLDFIVNGHVPGRDGNRDPRSAPHGVFPCAGTEQWVALSADSDAEWQGLVAAMDSPEWARDPSLATLEGRKAREAELEQRLAEWTSGLPRAEVVRRVQEHGARAYPVNSMADLFSDPQLAARGHWREVQHPVMGALRVAAPPAVLRATPPRAERAAPLMGADNGYVLGDILGLSADEIKRLEDEGVIA